jgi:hypothetical protein
MLSSLYIVIVNWNLKDDTLVCIESIFQAGVKANQVIVVDNGSQDGSVETLKASFPSPIHIIENNQNLGFAQGSNQGIEYALIQGAQWILLLNNDTTVAPDFFDELVSAMYSNNHYSIISPIIYYYDQPKIIWYLGDRLIPGTLITRSIMRNKADTKPLPNILPVDFVSGCAMMVNKEVFVRVGLFDPSLIMYGEEIDFCWRASQAGYQIACATRARVWHKVSLSADKDKSKSRYLKHRNQIQFYRKYSKGVQIPIMFFFSIFKLLQLSVVDLIHHKKDLIPFTARAWLDGWS